MAKTAVILFVLFSVGCILVVQGNRIDLPKVLPGGKYFAPPVPKADPRCEKDGIFADPTDCTKYIVCKGGKSTIRDCPEGFKFDTEKHCTPDEDADCGKSSSSPNHLKAKSDDDVKCPEYYGDFSYPDDCHKYISCNQGKATVKPCPAHTVYAINVGCIVGDVCPPAASSSLCKEQNGLYSIAGECHKYIKCVDGQPQEKKCPRGQGFDRKKLQCSKKARCRSNELHEIIQH